MAAGCGEAFRNSRVCFAILFTAFSSVSIVFSPGGQLSVPVLLLFFGGARVFFAISMLFLSGASLYPSRANVY